MIGVHLTPRLQLVFGIPIAILVVLSVVSYRSVAALSTDAAWVRSTHRVIEELAAVHSAVQDVESGARGFAFAGDRTFLASYEEGVVKAPAALTALATLTAADPRQQQHLARLTPLVNQNLQIADKIVRLRRGAGAQAAPERVADGDGIRLTAAIRSLLGDMRDEEERSLVDHQAISDRDFQRIALFLPLRIITAIVLLGLAGWTVNSDTAARRKSEQALRASEERLRLERDRAQEYLDTAEVVLLGLDREGRITLINRKGCDLLGWPANELVGRDWIETCLPVRLRGTFRASLHALLRGDRPTGENAVLTKSGDERLIDWRNRLLRDDAGNVVGSLSSGLDITERAHAEEEVRQSAQRSLLAEQGFRELFAANPLPMWTYDLTTLQFLEVNDAAVRRYGYSRDEFLAMTISDIRPPEDVEGLLADTREPREPWQHAAGWHHRLKSGLIIDVDITSHTISVAGRPAALVVAQDITARKRAEEAIRDHGRLSALSAAVGLAMTVTDSLAAALQECSAALVTHLDAALARIWTLSERGGVLELQASFGLYTHLDGPHGTVAPGQFRIGRIASDRKPYLTNAVIGDPEVSDQEWARREGMVAFAGHPLIVSGRVVGVVAIFARHALSDTVLSALGSVAHHIALGIERHRSAEALRSAEERTRFALVTAGVGIWDMDYATGVLKWSETLESQYGLQKGTFGGTFEAFVERIHPDDRAMLLETVGKAAQFGTDFSVLNRSLWPDGTVRWLSGAGRVLLGDRGEPVRGVGISLDVTDRRSLEEQFEQAQKMEVIGQLAGGVAHDFNSQLTVILGYCEMLLADSHPDDLRIDITEIQRAGMKAAALTLQLLTLSRKEIIEPTRLDLDVVVSEMCAMVGRLIGEHVAIVLGLQPGLAPVLADRGQVEQIVMNLAVNAGDAMPGGGTLTIETANVELDAVYVATHPTVEPGPYVLLAVSDTGTGMTPQVQARLFEPFFTTKELGKGTGLGLATVREIVVRIGGTVDVHSEIGKGTSFRVYLPKMDAEAALVDAPPSSRQRAGPQTVLVVDDDAALCLLTKRMLEQQGYNVVLAANGEEALQVFDRNPAIGLLLTDVVMPGASGPQLTRLLLEKQPTLKVVYMSGYAQEAIARHGIVEAGITLVRKPFTSAALAQKLREAVDS